MVERLETLDSSEAIQESTIAELSDLKIELKDQKKFEDLLQNADFQGACEKIFNQASNNALGEDWEKLKNINVSNVLKRHTKNDMGLKLYVEAVLGLKDAGNFKDLTNEQKLNFTAINAAFKTEKSTENIIKKTEELKEKYVGKMYNSFNWTNIKNFLQLKKTLQGYGLNEKEIQKYQEFMELVDKNETIKNMLLEEIAKYSATLGLGLKKGPGPYPMIAGWVVALLVAIGAAALIGVGYMARWLQELKNKPKEELHSYTTSTGMQEILQRASYEDNNAAFLDKELGVYEIDEEAGLIERIRKGTVNYVQNKEVIMVVNGTVKAQFDLYNDGCRGDISYDEYTKKFTYDIYLPEPKLVTQDVSMHAKEQGRELVKLRDWDNIQGKMLEEGKAQLIEEAKNKGIIPKAKHSIKKQITGGISEVLNPICNEHTGFTYEINVHFPSDPQNPVPQQQVPQMKDQSVVPESLQLPTRK